VFNELVDNNADPVSARRFAAGASVVVGALEGVMSPAALLSVPMKPMAAGVSKSVHKAFKESAVSAWARFGAGRVVGFFGELSEETAQGGAQAAITALGAAFQKDPEVMANVMESFVERLNHDPDIKKDDRATIHEGIGSLIRKIAISEGKEAVLPIAGLALLGIPVGGIFTAAEIQQTKSYKGRAEEGLAAAKLVARDSTSIDNRESSTVTLDQLLEGTESRQEMLSRLAEISEVGHSIANSAQVDADAAVEMDRLMVAFKAASDAGWGYKQKDGTRRREDDVRSENEARMVRERKEAVEEVFKEALDPNADMSAKDRIANMSDILEASVEDVAENRTVLREQAEKAKANAHSSLKDKVLKKKKELASRKQNDPERRQLEAILLEEHDGDKAAVRKEMDKLKKEHREDYILDKAVELSGKEKETQEVKELKAILLERSNGDQAAADVQLGKFKQKFDDNAKAQAKEKSDKAEAEQLLKDQEELKVVKTKIENQPKAIEDIKAVLHDEMPDLDLEDQDNKVFKGLRDGTKGSGGRDVEALPFLSSKLSEEAKELLLDEQGAAEDANRIWNSKQRKVLAELNEQATGEKVTTGDITKMLERGELPMWLDSRAFKVLLDSKGDTSIPSRRKRDLEGRRGKLETTLAQPKTPKEDALEKTGNAALDTLGDDIVSFRRLMATQKKLQNRTRRNQELREKEETYSLALIEHQRRVAEAEEKGVDPSTIEAVNPDDFRPGNMARYDLTDAQKQKKAELRKPYMSIRRFFEINPDELIDDDPLLNRFASVTVKRNGKPVQIRGQWVDENGEMNYVLEWDEVDTTTGKESKKMGLSTTLSGDSFTIESADNADAASRRLTEDADESRKAFIGEDQELDDENKIRSANAANLVGLQAAAETLRLERRKTAKGDPEPKVPVKFYNHLAQEQEERELTLDEANAEIEKLLKSQEDVARKESNRQRRGAGGAALADNQNTWEAKTGSDKVSTGAIDRASRSVEGEVGEVKGLADIGALSREIDERHREVVEARQELKVAKAARKKQGIEAAQVKLEEAELLAEDARNRYHNAQDFAIKRMTTAGAGGINATEKVERRVIAEALNSTKESVKTLRLRMPKRPDVLADDTRRAKEQTKRSETKDVADPDALKSETQNLDDEAVSAQDKAEIEQLAIVDALKEELAGKTGAQEGLNKRLRDAQKKLKELRANSVIVTMSRSEAKARLRELDRMSSTTRTSTTLRQLTDLLAEEQDVTTDLENEGLPRPHVTGKGSGSVTPRGPLTAKAKNSLLRKRREALKAAVAQKKDVQREQLEDLYDDISQGVSEIEDSDRKTSVLGGTIRRMMGAIRELEAAIDENLSTEKETTRSAAIAKLEAEIEEKSARLASAKGDAAKGLERGIKRLRKELIELVDNKIPVTVANAAARGRMMADAVRMAGLSSPSAADALLDARDRSVNMALEAEINELALTGVQNISQENRSDTQEAQFKRLNEARHTLQTRRMIAIANSLRDQIEEVSAEAVMQTELEYQIELQREEIGLIELRLAQTEAYRKELGSKKDFETTEARELFKQEEEFAKQDIAEAKQRLEELQQLELTVNQRRVMSPSMHILNGSLRAGDRTTTQERMEAQLKELDAYRKKLAKEIDKVLAESGIREKLSAFTVERTPLTIIEEVFKRIRNLPLRRKEAAASIERAIFESVHNALSPEQRKEMATNLMRSLQSEGGGVIASTTQDMKRAVTAAIPRGIKLRRNLINNVVANVGSAFEVNASDITTAIDETLNDMLPTLAKETGGKGARESERNTVRHGVWQRLDSGREADPQTVVRLGQEDGVDTEADLTADEEQQQKREEAERSDRQTGEASEQSDSIFNGIREAGNRLNAIRNSMELDSSDLPELERDLMEIRGDVGETDDTRVATSVAVDLDKDGNIMRTVREEAVKLFKDNKKAKSGRATNKNAVGEKSKAKVAENAPDIRASRGDRVARTASDELTSEEIDQLNKATGTIAEKSREVAIDVVEKRLHKEWVAAKLDRERHTKATRQIESALSIYKSKKNMQHADNPALLDKAITYISGLIVDAHFLESDTTLEEDKTPGQTSYEDKLRRGGYSEAFLEADHEALVNELRDMLKTEFTGRLASALPDSDASIRERFAALQRRRAIEPTKVFKWYSAQLLAAEADMAYAKAMMQKILDPQYVSMFEDANGRIWTRDENGNRKMSSGRLTIKNLQTMHHQAKVMREAAINRLSKLRAEEKNDRLATAFEIAMSDALALSEILDSNEKLDTLIAKFLGVSSANLDEESVARALAWSREAYKEERPAALRRTLKSHTANVRRSRATGGRQGYTSQAEKRNADRLARGGARPMEASETSSLSRRMAELTKLIRKEIPERIKEKRREIQKLEGKTDAASVKARNAKQGHIERLQSRRVSAKNELSQLEQEAQQSRTREQKEHVLGFSKRASFAHRMDALTKFISESIPALIQEKRSEIKELEGNTDTASVNARKQKQGLIELMKQRRENAKKELLQLQKDVLLSHTREQQDLVLGEIRLLLQPIIDRQQHALALGRTYGLEILSDALRVKAEAIEEMESRLVVSWVDAHGAVADVEQSRTEVLKAQRALAEGASSTGLDAREILRIVSGAAYDATQPQRPSVGVTRPWQKQKGGLRDGEQKEPLARDPLVPVPAKDGINWHFNALAFNERFGAEVDWENDPEGAQLRMEQINRAVIDEFSRQLVEDKLDNVDASRAEIIASARKVLRESGLTTGMREIAAELEKLGDTAEKNKASAQKGKTNPAQVQRLSTRRKSLERRVGRKTAEVRSLDARTEAWDLSRAQNQLASLRRELKAVKAELAQEQAGVVPGRRLQTRDRAIGPKATRSTLQTFIQDVLGLKDVVVPTTEGLFFDGYIGATRVRMHVARGTGESSVDIQTGAVNLVWDIDSLTMMTPSHETIKHLGVAGLSDEHLIALAKYLGIKGASRMDRLDKMQGNRRILGLEELIVEQLDKLDTKEANIPMVQAAIAAIKNIMSKFLALFGVNYSPSAPFATLKSIQTGEAMRNFLGQGALPVQAGVRYSKNSSSSGKKKLTFDEARDIVGRATSFSEWTQSGTALAYAEWIYHEAEHRTSNASKNPTRREEVSKTLAMMPDPEIEAASSYEARGGDTFHARNALNTAHNVNFNQMNWTDLWSIVSPKMRKHQLERMAKGLDKKESYRYRYTEAVMDMPAEWRKTLRKNDMVSVRVKGVPIKMRPGHAVLLSMHLLSASRMSPQTKAGEDAVMRVLKAGIRFTKQTGAGGLFDAKAQQAKLQLESMEEVEAMLAAIRSANPAVLTEAARLDAVNKKFTPEVKEQYEKTFPNAHFSEREFYIHMIRDYRDGKNVQRGENTLAHLNKQGRDMLPSEAMMYAKDPNEITELQMLTGAGNSPLLVTDAYDTIMSSMNNTAKFIGFGDFVYDNRALLESQDFERMVTSTMGDKDLADKWIRSLEWNNEAMGGIHLNDSALPSFVRKVIRFFMSPAQAVWLSSPGVSLMQLASVFNFMGDEDVSFDVWFKALTTKLPDGAREKMLKNSPSVAYRSKLTPSKLSSLFDGPEGARGMGSIVVGPRNAGEWLAKFRDGGMFLTGKADSAIAREMAVRVAYWATEAKGLSEQEDFYESAGLKASMLTTGTQVQTNDENRTGLQKRHDALSMALSFMRGARSISGSAIMRGLLRASIGGMKWVDAARNNDRAAMDGAKTMMVGAKKDFLAQFAMHGMMQQGFVQLVRYARPLPIMALSAFLFGEPDDDEEEKLSPLKAIGNFASGVGGGIASLPIGGGEVHKLHRIIFAKGAEQRWAQRDAATSLHPITSLFEDMGKSAEQTRKVHRWVQELETGEVKIGSKVRDLTDRERTHKADQLNSEILKLYAYRVNLVGTWMVGAPGSASLARSMETAAKEKGKRSR